MKKHTKIVILWLLTVVIAIAIVLCSRIVYITKNAVPDGQDPILLAMSFSTSMVTLYAEKLSGEWADKYFEMLTAGHGPDSRIYRELYAILNEYTLESRAKNMYIMIFANALGMEIVMDTDKDVEDSIFREYNEIFQGVLEGTPMTEKYAHRDEQGDLFLSAYAKIVDSDGLYVAILGLDYPVPEFEEFPNLIKN